jgi:chromate transporter
MTKRLRKRRTRSGEERVVTTRQPVPPRELFLGFAHLGIVSFGGAIAWGRRLLVDERGWLTAGEFNEIVGLGQALPGPNMVNASVIIGSREGGALGAVAALGGILLPPFVVVLLVASLLARFADVPLVQHALHGSALAGAGLIVGTGLTMAMRLRGNALGIVLAVAALILLAVVRYPLPAILVVLVPVGVLLVVLRDRRAA